MEENQQYKDSIDDRIKSITGFLLIPSSFIREVRYFDRKRGKDFFEGRNIDRYVGYAILSTAEATRLWIYWSIIKEYL